MPVPRIELDRSSPVPLYFQISRLIEEAVDRGDLMPGERLPNEIEFAESLAISRPTMRKALDDLVDKGLLTRKQGVGTRVANAQVRRRVALTSLHEDLAAAGRQPETQVLRLDVACHDRHAARALGLPADGPMLYLERLRRADGRPLAILRNWLPPAYSDLSREDLERDGLYALLRARGGKPVVAHQRIGARPPTGPERKHLNLTPSQPVLTMSRTAFDAVGSPVEYGDHCYRAQDYSIEVMLDER
jgi:GntR family transcriptional regulator